jgi:hypothetical protein
MPRHQNKVLAKATWASKNMILIVGANGDMELACELADQLIEKKVKNGQTWLYRETYREWCDEISLEVEFV